VIKSRCPGLPGHPRAPWPAMVEPKALPRNGCASWCLGGCSWSCEFGYLWRSCIVQTGSTGDLVQLATPGFQVIWLKDWAKKIGSQRWIRVIHRHYQSSWSLYRVSSVYKYIYIHMFCNHTIPLQCDQVTRFAQFRLQASPHLLVLIQALLAHRAAASGRHPRHCEWATTTVSYHILPLLITYLWV
jgi:hypothetical protein